MTPNPIAKMETNRPKTIVTPTSIDPIFFINAIKNLSLLHNPSLESASSPTPGNEKVPNSGPKVVNRLENMIKIAHCLVALEHSSVCTKSTSSCPQSKCSKMKRIMAHVQRCPKRKLCIMDCQNCKQFVALCLYHAKSCHAIRCPVYFCESIKLKLKARHQKQIRVSPKKDH